MKNITCGQGAAGLRCLRGHRPAGEACAVMDVGEMLRWEKRWCTSKAWHRAQVWQDWSVFLLWTTAFSLAWSAPPLILCQLWLLSLVPARAAPVPAGGPWLEGMTDVGKWLLCGSKGKLFNKETGWPWLWRSLAGTQMLQAIAGWWLRLRGEGRQWSTAETTLETCDRGASWNLWDRWHQPTWNNEMNKQWTKKNPPHATEPHFIIHSFADVLCPAATWAMTAATLLCQLHIFLPQACISLLTCKLKHCFIASSRHQPCASLLFKFTLLANTAQDSVQYGYNWAPAFWVGVLVCVMNYVGLIGLKIPNYHPCWYCLSEKGSFFHFMLGHLGSKL